MRSYFTKSDRLGYSLWNNNDLDLAKALWGDSSVTKYISANGIFTDEVIINRLDSEIMNQKQYGVQYWPIFRLIDHTFVGCCGLRPYNLDDNIYEIGFHIKSSSWGYGFGKEAAEHIVQHAFGIVGADALFAGHNPNNLKSASLLKKLGFQYTGDEYYEPTGLNHPSYILRR